MKKQLFSVLSILMLCIGMQAQTNIANYTYVPSAGTYIPLTGATTFTNSWDDEVSAAIPLGGTFTYGATSYTSCFISANGFITFGAAPGGTNYTPLSTLGTTSGAISAFGQDAGSSTVVGATPSISYLNIGGATGEFVVQYADHANFSNRTTERLNFQIRLKLATGEINIVYGSWTASGSTGTTAQIGIRGNSTTFSTNVNNLNTVNIPAGNTCSWADAVTGVANNSSMYFNSANNAIAPFNGLTFTWAPPVNPSLAPVRTFSAVASITSSGAALAWTAPTGATQYNVQYRPNTSCSWTNFAGNPISATSATLTGLTPSTVYQIRVQSSDGTNNAIWSHLPNQAGTGGGYNTTAGTFSTLGIPTDLQTTSLQAPAVNSAGCYGSSIPVVVQIKNAGTSTLDFSTNNATVITNITGTNPQSFTTTVNTGTLAAGATQNVTVTATYNMSAVGVYTIDATSTLATPDANTTNDAMVATTRTNIAPVSAPFTNNFTGFAGANLSSVFPGWSEGTGATIPSGTTSGWLNQTGLNGTGNITAKVNLFSNTKNEWILTPKFAVTSGVNLQFDAAVTDFNSLAADPTGMAGTDDKVDVMISTDCGLTFTSLLSITQTNSLTPAFTPFTVNLSAYVGQNVIIGFMATEGTINDTPDYDFHIDNINIASCFAPTNLTTSNITTSSVDISWLAPTAGTPVSYVGEIRTSGAAGSGTLGLVSTGTITAPTTTANITPLTASTAYTIYLRSDCGSGDFSSWTTVTFTTLANCQVPTALNTSTVLATSANFTWTAGGTETAWDVYYGTQPLTVPNATTAPTATSSVASYSATGLTQMTPYSVYVRANCGAGSTSIWTAVSNFTTPASCPGTSFPLISAITPTTAVATWTAGSTETSWLVKYSAPTTTVLAGPTPSYTMTGLTPSSTYTIQVKGICAVGDSSAWTPVITFTTPCLPPNITSTTPGARCGVGTVTLAATADMGGTLNWYANASGGSALSTGTLFTTPTLTATTDFYVSATGAITTGNGGRTAPTATANTTASSYGLVFDAVKTFTLNSVDVFPTGTAGNLTVNLTNNTGVVLQTTTVAIPTGTVGTPYTVPLNFNVTPGTGYRLIAVTSPNMIRESSLGGFPYSLGQVGNITSGYISGTSQTYYFFYNWQFSYGCESARTAVTATVNTAPALSVTNGTTICTNAVQTLNITSTLSDYDSYVWTPNTNLYTDAAATIPYTGGNATTLYYSSSTINSTAYMVNATNTVSGCVNSANVSMTADMPEIFASATPTLLCSGNTVSLTANTNIVTSGTANLGLGDLTTTASGTSSGNYVSPYSHYYGGYKAQYIVRASELQAIGLTAGNITSLSFSVTTAGTTYSNFAVSMASTTQSVATTTFNGSVSQVYGPSNETPTTGLNTYAFTSPFNWDGTSNVVIQICWSNNNPGGTASEVTYNTTSFVSTSYYRVDNQTSSFVCGQTSATSTTSNRPFMVLNGQKTTQGAGTINWQWNPGAINSNSTTVMPVNTGTTSSVESYTVTALDPATTCTNSAVVSITVNPIPTVTASASSASVCAGSSATLTAGGASTFTWSSGGNTATDVVTPSSASVYTVTGTDNGCSNTATVAVGVNPIPVVTAMATQTLLCDDGSTGSSILTASSTATSFLWSDGAMTMTTSVTPTITTVYTVTATESGCSADAYVTVTVSNCNGIKESVANGISIYPNPTNGVLNISISSELAGTASIEVYDAIGKLVIKDTLSNDANTINLSKLEDGMYVFKIINNNKAIKVGKVVKQ